MSELNKTSRFHAGVNVCETRVIFDADGVRKPGFIIFAEEWRKIQPPCWCHIPRFEYIKLTGTERSLADALIADRRMSVLECGNEPDYNILFEKLAGMKLQSIAAVFNAAVSVAVLAAGRRSSINVRFHHLTDDGRLEPEQRDNPHKGFKIATKPESIVILPLRRRADLKVGSMVYTNKGTPVRLKKEAMANADSITYITDRSGEWAKIYDPKSLTTLIEKKSERMLSKEVKFDGLCWPTEILRDVDGVFAGVLVPEAEGTPLRLCVFGGVENGIGKYFPKWDKRNLTQLSITILEKIKYMHGMGILFGCLNHASILVKDEKTVYFADTDRYQIEGFPCMFRTVMFTPPELQEKLRNEKLYLCSIAHDKYAVALLFFMLMMPGKMPYAIENSAAAPDSIMKQRFEFSYKGVHGSNRTVGSWRFVWSHLSPELKEKFYKTFQVGEWFNAPDKRLPAALWLELAKNFKEELEEKMLFDVHSRELVPKSFKRSSQDTFYQCRYCGIEHPKWYFDERYIEEYRICKTCLGKPSDKSFQCVDCDRIFIYTNETAIYHARQRQQNDDWKIQKHCKDCRSKTAKCGRCPKIVPLFSLSNVSGYCPECEKIRKDSVYQTKICRDCPRSFTITVGEYESYRARGHTPPVRCPNCRGSRR